MNIKGEKSACVKTGDCFSPIFTIKVRDDVIEQQLIQDMIDMINIFDEVAELDEDGDIVGPVVDCWVWSEDIVDRYRQYVKDDMKK